MKKLILLFLIALSSQLNAQVFNMAFQIENPSIYTNSIFDQLELANGNIAMGMSLQDSTSISSPYNLFHIPSNTVNRGAGIVIMNSSNQIVWHREWEPLNTDPANRCTIYSLEEDNAGNLYIVGTFQGPMDLDPTTGTEMVTPISSSHHVGFVVKLDNAGNFLWAKTLQSATAFYASAHTFKSVLSPNGNITLCGAYQDTVDFDPNIGTQISSSTPGDHSTFLVTLDASGNFVNLRTIDFLGPNGNIFNNITQIESDALGDIYVSYTFKDSMDIDFGSGTKYYFNPSATQSCLVKYDSNFNILWDEVMPPQYGLTRFSIAANNLYVFSDFVGTATLNDNSTVASNGNKDIVYEKWTTTGACLWSKTLGGSQQDYASSFQEFNNELYLLYSFVGSVNTNTGNNDVVLNAPNRNIALTRLNSNAQHLKTSLIESDSTILLSPHGLLLSGNTIRLNFRNRGITDVDPSITVTNNLSPQWGNTFSQAVLIWNQFPTSIKNIESRNNIAVYPNPNDGIMSLELATKHTIDIYNILGVKVYTQEGYIGTNKLNLAGIPSGSYLMKCHNDKSILNSKITILK